MIIESRYAMRRYRFVQETADAEHYSEAMDTGLSRACGGRPLLIVGLILILKAYCVQTHDAILLQCEMTAHLASRVQTLIRL
jgi:hypothetical protein